MTSTTTVRTWRQRQRDHHIARPSNARYRCADCGVEVYAHATYCSTCGARRTRARHANNTNAQPTE